MPNIVVIGAGVSGLTCALQLAKQKGNNVTIVAKHMPGDYDIEYTSPWAGANVLPMLPKEQNRWESRSWPELKRLAQEVPEAGVHFQKSKVFRRKPLPAAVAEAPGISDSLFDQDPWYKNLMEDYHELEPSSLPPGVESGVEFTSVCLNLPVYLSWLLGQCLAHGAVIRRAVVAHISEAAGMSHAAPGGKADVVVNATGLMSLKLGGVMDTKLYPIRGQTVLVRNVSPFMACVDKTEHAGDEMCYMMTRAAGGGTILGGTYQPGRWDPNPDPNIAVRIMKRAVELNPALTDGQGIEALSIIRHAVGLRPGREGGVRLEKELIDGTWVVHNYGHAGWGYQGSYGCAERVLELVDEIVGGAGNLRPKL
ncbi:D-amino acid oxidase-like protein [Thozetella sp. PMI_491]|nr:D-amino acid oxidase-like protein [Thozetella sp. PMI_491]